MGASESYNFPQVQPLSHIDLPPLTEEQKQMQKQIKTQLENEKFSVNVSGWKDLDIGLKYNDKILNPKPDTEYVNPPPLHPIPGTMPSPEEPIFPLQPEILRPAIPPNPDNPYDNPVSKPRLPEPEGPVIMAPPLLEDNSGDVQESSVEESGEPSKQINFGPIIIGGALVLGLLFAFSRKKEN